VDREELTCDGGGHQRPRGQGPSPGSQVTEKEDGGGAAGSRTVELTGLVRAKRGLVETNPTPAFGRGIEFRV